MAAAIDTDSAYLDSAGRLCEDQTARVEEIEYDEQIHCTVQMRRRCEDGDDLDNVAAGNEEDEEELSEACHTMYKKECRITYRPRMTKVRVRVCPNGGVKVVKSLRPGRTDGNNSVVIDVRPEDYESGGNGLDDSNGGKGACDPATGKRKICVKKYETECRTRYVKQEMEEDRPQCRVQLMEKCGGGGEEDENGLLDDCVRVPAMRCKIEKVMVMKSKPETKCVRVPREFCRKEACEAEKEECYFRNQVVS